jgi:hypothetical protein
MTNRSSQKTESTSLTSVIESPIVGTLAVFFSSKGVVAEKRNRSCMAAIAAEEQFDVMALETRGRLP